MIESWLSSFVVVLDDGTTCFHRSSIFSVAKI
jgi:hypothetical protein